MLHRLFVPRGSLARAMLSATLLLAPISRALADEPGPTITAIAAQSTEVGTATSALPFTVGDPAVPAEELTVTADSSDPILVPVDHVVIAGSGAERTVAITPAMDHAGQATITLTVSNGTATAMSAFVLTVVARPTISAIANRAMNVGDPGLTVTFAVGKIDADASSLTVSATSSNETLVPASHLYPGGSGTLRTLDIGPAQDQAGSTTITLQVSDGTASASTSFVLTVNALPTITKIADLTLNEGAPSAVLPFTIADGETKTASLIVTASSSNTKLVPAAGLTLGGSGADRTLMITPVGGQLGSTTITLSVGDGKATAARSFVATVIAPYAIMTLAGDPGGRGFSDGTGRNARFMSPQGIAMDAAGNLFVTDLDASTVRKIAPGGIVTTLAGSAVSNGYGIIDGRGATAHFSRPQGIAVDAAGTVYVADTDNHAIRRISRDGIVTTLAGGVPGSADGTGLDAQFIGPQSVAIDASGTLLVADGSAIRKVTAAGAVSTFVGMPGLVGSVDGSGKAARFSRPRQMAVDPTGNIYVVDSGNHTLRKITPAGKVTTLAGKAGQWGTVDGTGSAARLAGPTGLALEPGGTLIVVGEDCLVRRVTTAGKVTTIAGTTKYYPGGSYDGVGGIAWFSAPSAVAVDKTGNIYVCDTGHSAIRRITPSLAVTTYAGSPQVFGSNDGKGRDAHFTGPTGIGRDQAGNLYVADWGNSTIRKITPSGVVTTFAGTPGLRAWADGVGAAAAFNRPAGLCVDTSGNVYVADAINYVIRKITPSRRVTTLAGKPGENGANDGTGTTARIGGPGGLAVDQSGNLYFADEWADVVRKITPAGKVTTLAGKAYEMGLTDGKGAAARFNSPSGVAVDASGSVYVADLGNRCIRKITSAGVVTTLAGSSDFTETPVDGALKVARFLGPLDVAIDGAGNLYVTDAGRLRRISKDGIVTTLAGQYLSGPGVDGAGAEATLGNSTLTADAAGNVYIADAQNNSVRIGSPLPVLLSTNHATGAVGQAFNVTMRFSGSVTRFSATGLPAGLELDATRGVIAGTPTRTGVYAVKITAANAAGTAKGGTILTLTIVQPPTISALASRALAPGSAGFTASFTIADADTDLAKLKIAVTSSNPTLVPAANLMLAGTGASRTLTVTPAKGGIGRATITVTVSDGVVTTTRTFTVTVNTPPTISAITNQTIAKNGTSPALKFRIGDKETSTAKLTLTKASSNTKLVPLAGIVFGGSGANRTVKITPANNLSGSAKLTLTVDDGTDVVSTSFTVTVQAAAKTKAVAAAVPAISHEPKSQVVKAGADVTLSATVAGRGTVHRQWTHDGATVPGATADTLTLPRVRMADAGAYALRVTDAAGSVASRPTKLVVVDSRANMHASSGLVAVTQDLLVAGERDGCTLSVLLPSGWTYLSGDANGAAGGPQAGDTDLLEWTWPAGAAAPRSFHYVLRAPATAVMPDHLESVLEVHSADGVTRLLFDEPKK